MSEDAFRLLPLRPASSRRSWRSIITAASSARSFEIELRKRCPGPCAKVFRRKIPAGDLMKISIHVAGGHITHSTFFIDVCEKILSGQILATAHELCELRVVDVDAV